MSVMRAAARTARVVFGAVTFDRFLEQLLSRGPCRPDAEVAPGFHDFPGAHGRASAVSGHGGPSDRCVRKPAAEDALQRAVAGVPHHIRPLSRKAKVVKQKTSPQLCFACAVRAWAHLGDWPSPPRCGLLHRRQRACFSLPSFQARKRWAETGSPISAAILANSAGIKRRPDCFVMRTCLSDSRSPVPRFV
jgi:hypothetical protein